MDLVFLYIFSDDCYQYHPSLHLIIIQNRVLYFCSKKNTFVLDVMFDQNLSCHIYKKMIRREF